MSSFGGLPDYGHDQIFWIYQEKYDILVLEENARAALDIRPIW